MKKIIVIGFVYISSGLYAAHNTSVVRPVMIANNSEKSVVKMPKKAQRNSEELPQQELQSSLEPQAIAVAHVERNNKAPIGLQIAIPLTNKDITPEGLVVADVMPVAVARPIPVAMKKASGERTIITSVNEIDSQSIGKVDDVLSTFASSNDADADQLVRTAHNADVDQLVHTTQHLPFSKQFFREINNVQQKSLKSIKDLVDVAQEHKKLQKKRLELEQQLQKPKLSLEQRELLSEQLDLFDREVDNLQIDLVGGFKIGARERKYGVQDDLREDYQSFMEDVRDKTKQDLVLEKDIAATIDAKIKKVKGGYKTSQELFDDLQIGSYEHFLKECDRAVSVNNSSQALLNLRNLLERKFKVSLDSQEGRQKLQDLYETLTLIEAKKGRSNKSIFSTSSSVNEVAYQLQRDLLKIDPFLLSAHDVVMMQSYKAESLVLHQVKFIYHLADKAVSQISQLQI